MLGNLFFCLNQLGTSEVSAGGERGRGWALSLVSVMLSVRTLVLLLWVFYLLLDLEARCENPIICEIIYISVSDQTLVI